MANVTLDIKTLAALEPISRLNPARLRGLLDYCHIEEVEPGQNPFQNCSLQQESVYLLQGELALTYADGNQITIHAGSEWAHHPLGKRQPGVVAARALSPAQLLHIEDDLLDRLVTWDQLAAHEEIRQKIDQAGSKATVRRWLNSGLFSVEKLVHGPFAHLPPANISKLISRIEAVAVWDKDVIVREGEEGNYYYLIESGCAEVTRSVGGVEIVLAELKAGDAFGEEALISDSKRNATVTMQSDGVLLRIRKQDFLELMEEPLLHRISFEEAQQKVKEGAVWLDVRYPPEFRHDRLPGAINLPLNEIRDAIDVLDRTTAYIVYCQSGRRSAAAAFILAQAGYEVYVLENGLWSVPRTSQ